MAAPKPPSPQTQLPFKYLGGDPSLDLVNTVDWTPRGLANERLTSYERLTRWAEVAGLLPSSEAESLRAAARSQPRETRAALTRARRLRSTLQRLYAGLVSGTLAASGWDDFNTELAGALKHLAVEALDLAVERRRSERKRALRPDWTWRVPQGRLDAFLWPVVWSAARLLTSDEADQIQVCGGPDCGWIYVDRSRNGQRRWCAMETCGTAEKTRRRRVRHRRRADGPGGP